MGNKISHCTHRFRKLIRPCAGKGHGEDEAMLNCDSDHIYKSHDPLFETSVTSCYERESSFSRDGSRTSLVRHHDQTNQDISSLYIAPIATTRSSTPKLGRLSLCSPGNHGYRSLTSCSNSFPTDTGREDGHVRKGHLVDRGSQTSQTAFLGTGGTHTDGNTDLREPFSKEYIVKTYIIQNATPSPSPATLTKFPANGARNECDNSVSLDSGYTSQHDNERTSQQTHKGISSSNTPLGALEKRQEAVLERLQQLQSSVSKLKQKYNVQDDVIAAPTVNSIAQKSCSSYSSCVPLVGKGILDVVISADPSSIPYSLLVLCSELCNNFAVLQATFVHSSVSGNVPDNLCNLLTSNGSIKRANAQIAITLIWKKVVNGPQLVVDPTQQTPIMGEANIARYLKRLLHPGSDYENIVVATQTDELLDLAQLQLLNGNTKERAAAVRSLNSILGKADWLTGGEPGLADIVVWSAMQQAGQVTSSPANVKKWLALCSKNCMFKRALSIIS